MEVTITLIQANMLSSGLIRLSLTKGDFSDRSYDCDIKIKPN